MSDNLLTHLKSLHTNAIDARDGYRRAIQDSPDSPIAQILHDMASLHDRNAAELSRALIQQGEKADDDGSFMGIVHRAIMDVRSLFGALDASIFPGLIDGERRNVKAYDDALTAGGSSDSLSGELTKQRAALLAAIDSMKTSQDAVPPA